jgi:ATP-dependent Clp protease protease subunit
MLTEYKGKVTVKIDGIAASAASVIAMAGDEILMSPVSTMMIHNPLTVAWGDHNEMQKAIDMLNEVKESIINAYAVKTGLSRAKLSRLMETETWMNANKAVELGFVDGIIERERTEDENTSDVLFSCRETQNTLINKLTAKCKNTDEETTTATKEHSVRDITERLNYIKKHI